MRNIFYVLFAILILMIVIVTMFILFLNSFIDLKIPYLGLSFSILVASALIILIYWSHVSGYDKQVFEFNINKN